MENLPTGYTLYATTEKAEAFNVMVFGEIGNHELPSPALQKQVIHP